MVLLAYVALRAKWVEVGVPFKFSALTFFDDMLNVVSFIMVQ